MRLKPVTAGRTHRGSAAIVLLAVILIAVIFPQFFTPEAGNPESAPESGDIAIRHEWTDGAAIRADETVSGIRFGLCARPPFSNCVIDGDTFYLAGVSIRVADIDTPEINPPRCAEEERLGEDAKERLLELLNAGPFSLGLWQGRDEDQYGRILRVPARDGRSFGDILAAEGLARRWEGQRRPWCP